MIVVFQVHSGEKFLGFRNGMVLYAGEVEENE
jgi:hypothetical protein